MGTNPIDTRDILPLGTMTKFGKVSAVGMVSGERYYWLIDKHGVVSMQPAMVVETFLEPS